MKEFYTHLPIASRKLLPNLIEEHPIEIKVVNTRKSKHGDFRKLPTGHVQITLNRHPNPYRFLITLLHEIAHHIAFKVYGFKIQPHGKEWKKCFQHISVPFLVEQIFPPHLLKVFTQHLRNPKASSDTDLLLSLALREYDPPTNKALLMTLSHGSHFQLDNGRIFQKGLQRRKRFECQETATKRIYLFQPNAEVQPLKHS